MLSQANTPEPSSVLPAPVQAAAYDGLTDVRSGTPRTPAPNRRPPRPSPMPDGIVVWLRKAQAEQCRT
ncbi:hypothetical protein PV392_17670 [Streptomyces sp. ME03-5709C]|nr:hypothetical protein [Streptomyces sp. ME03-5709C]